MSPHKRVRGQQTMNLVLDKSVGRWYNVSPKTSPPPPVYNNKSVIYPLNLLLRLVHHLLANF